MGSRATMHVLSKVLIGLSLSIVLIIAIRIIRMPLGSYLFKVKYDQLEIGMSKPDVLQIWDHPEFVIFLEDGKEIWSYKNKGHPIHFVLFLSLTDTERQRKTENVSLEELDDMNSYSNAEMLFDINGELEAYTIIGDTLVVHSRYGNVPGPRWDVYAEFLGNLPHQVKE